MLVLFSIRLLARMLRSGTTVLLLLMIGYFAIFAFDGDRGYASLHSKERQVANAQEQLKQVRGEREAIERKVMALRPSSIDGDLLDEEVRGQLGYVRPGEIVILNR